PCSLRAIVGSTVTAASWFENSPAICGPKCVQTLPDQKNKLCSGSWAVCVSIQGLKPAHFEAKTENLTTDNTDNTDLHGSKSSIRTIIKLANPISSKSVSSASSVVRFAFCAKPRTGALKAAGRDIFRNLLVFRPCHKTFGCTQKNEEQKMTRDEVIGVIRQTTEELGRVPSMNELVTTNRLSRYDLRKHFAV